LKLLARAMRACRIRNCSIPTFREWYTSLGRYHWARGGARSSFAAEIVLCTIRGTPHSHLPLKCEQPRQYLRILLAPYRSRTPAPARLTPPRRTEEDTPPGPMRTPPPPGPPHQPMPSAPMHMPVQPPSMLTSSSPSPSPLLHCHRRRCLSHLPLRSRSLHRCHHQPWGSAKVTQEVRYYFSSPQSSRSAWCV
jgi:hypothetical protein